MKTIARWDHLSEFGIIPLTGESCGLGYRILCDVTAKGKIILEKCLGIPALNLPPNWNTGSEAEPHVGSIMLAPELLVPIAIFALLENGCKEVWKVENQGVHGIQHSDPPDTAESLKKWLGTDSLRRLAYRGTANATKVSEAEAKVLRPYVDFETATDINTTAREQHRELKKRLEATLGDRHIRRFEASWTGATVSQDHLDRLCDTVLADLRGVIESEIAKFAEIKPLDAEIAAHKQFGELRGGKDRFKGREGLMSRIAAYLSVAETNRPLVIFGPAGTGKSAIIARAAVDARERQPQAVILERFLGATPPSVDARSLLQSFCEELGRQFQNNAEVPLEYRELVGAFRERLALATAERPVIVFLDAVDQLSETDNARSLVWLPRQLPPHVRLVVSVLEDPLAAPMDAGGKTPTNADPLAILKRRAKPEDLLPIDDYPRNNAQALLDYWLRADKRMLTADKEKLVLGAFERCPRPLFLKLAAEEAKQWRSDSKTATMPNADSPDAMLSAIINQLFDRLSEKSNHGDRLVERAVSYLTASKNGLTEDELLGLLSTDKEFFVEFVNRANSVGQPLPKGIESLPVAVWVRLYSDLQPYLTTRRGDGTMLLAFYHRSLEQVARQRFLATPEIAGQRHKHIANYFTPKEPYGFFRLTLDEQRAWAKKLPPEPRPVNIRMVMELPHQLLEVGKLLGKDDAMSPHWDAVADLLLNIHFLEAKAEAKP